MRNPFYALLMEGLKDKLNNRVITRMMDHPWPSESRFVAFELLELLVLEYCISRAYTDIDDLKETVMESFAVSRIRRNVKEAVHSLSPPSTIACFRGMG